MILNLLLPLDSVCIIVLTSPFYFSLGSLAKLFLRAARMVGPHRALSPGLDQAELKLLMDHWIFVFVFDLTAAFLDAHARPLAVAKVDRILVAAAAPFAEREIAHGF